MRKALSVAPVLFVVLTLSLPACAGSGPAAKSETTTLRVGYVNAPAALFWLAGQNQKKFENAGLAITFYPFAQETELIQAIMGGSIDIATMGSATSANLYNKGVDVKIIQGQLPAPDFMMVPKNSTIASYKDLKGKRVGLPGLAGTTAIVEKYLMKSAGLDLDKDVRFVDGPPPVLVQFADKGDIDAFPAWEPNASVALATGRYKIAMSGGEEWKKDTGKEPWIHGVTVVKGDFLAKNPNTVRKVLQIEREMIEWVNNNPKEAAKIGSEPLKMKPEVIEDSFTRVKLYSRPMTEADKESLRTLWRIINDSTPDAVAGKVPDDKIFASVQ